MGYTKKQTEVCIFFSKASMDSFGPYIIGLVIGFALLAPALHILWRRLKSHEEERQTMGQQIVQLQEVLVGMPDGLYRWNVKNGVENCSARMAVMLGLSNGTKSRYSDILQRFDHEASRSLDRSVSLLHREGVSFDVLLPLSGPHEQIIQAVGQRVLSEDGSPLVDLLWMRFANEAVMDNGPIARDLQETTNERNKLIAALDALPQPVWIRDASGEVTYANPATPDWEMPKNVAQRALEAGRAARERITIPYVEGRQTYDLREIPLPNGEGTLGTAQDVTALENARETAQRGENVLRAALENLVTAIAVFNGDTRLGYYNTAYALLWGLDRKWLDGKPTYGEILDRLRETRRLPEYANFKAFRQEQLAKFVELRQAEEHSLHLPNNSTLRAIISPHPVSGLVMTFEDVTDTLALESSNKSLSAVQRETLDNLFEGVIVFGPDGRVRLFNPAFAEIWHLSPDFLNTHPHITEVLEKCRDFYDGVEDWSVFKEQMAARFMMREPQNQRLVRSDGHMLEYASVPLPDGGSLLSYLDVSDSAIVEQAKEESTNAQYVADRLKSEFIANVSYEIRTPLTTLVGFADLLCEEYFGALNKRQLEYANGIQSSARQLSHLVSDILDLATIEAGQVELALETVDIQDLLVSVLGLVRESAKHKQISIEFNCPQDIGWITADQKRLKQVMFNLLTNAVRHTHKGGTIAITANRTSDQLVLGVADDGEGITASEQDRVFHSFQRARQMGAADGGAGLGLTLVKHFIDLHGGHVTLDSIEKKGTVVTCYIPLEDK